MKAYLIDPQARTVTSVDVAEDDGDDATLDSWYAHMQCADVENVTPLNAEGDLLLLDEYAKFHEPRGFFFCRLWPHDTLRGRALWVGVTEEGEAASPKCSLEDVAGHISWLDVPSHIMPIAPGIFIMRGKQDDE